MGGFGGSLGNANFQEPASPDQTSAPQMPAASDPNFQQQAPTPGQSLAQALIKRKKVAGIGPTVKQPATLLNAIARARRARQGSQKYGG